MQLSGNFFVEKVVKLNSLTNFATRKPVLINKVMKELVAKINEQIALFQENAALQVEKNNKAAGTRARKAALELSKLMKEFRKESVEAAKN